MVTPEELDDYMAVIRRDVCSHCVERPAGGPPCAPLGKRCGIEIHLAEIVDICHGVKSAAMDPYVAHLHDDICARCANATTEQCPCPLEYLLQLAVEAIERADEQDLVGPNRNPGLPVDGQSTAAAI